MTIEFFRTVNDHQILLERGTLKRLRAVIIWPFSTATQIAGHLWDESAFR
jgi:hypothetical protein